MACIVKSESIIILKSGSIVAEGPCSWRWIGTRIPRVRGIERFVRSPTFRYQDTEWFLRCCETADGLIRLWLYPKIWPLPPLAPFAVSVSVRGVGSDSNGLDSVVEPQRTSLLIWQRKTSEVERISHGFRSCRLLTFRIDIKEKDPQRGCNSPRATAFHCPQPEMHSKTFADASVQTCLTTNNISCLDALSEDFSRMLEANSDPDVEINCKGHSTRAHKCVLCSRSPVLAKMLHSDMVEGRTGVVNIQDMDVDTFRRFLLYLYTGKLGEDSLTFDSAMSLYEAGDMYGVISLKTFCSDFLRSKLTFANAREVLAVADAHSDASLAEAATAYALQSEIIPHTIQEAGAAFSTLGERRKSPYFPPFSKNHSHNDCDSAQLFTLAYHCPRPEVHTETSADASVQTSLTAHSISCLDALSQDFSKMLDADSDFDVELNYQGHSIKAHKSVLCSRSPVLAQMLHCDAVDGGTGMVNDVDTFRRFLLYLYTGKLDEDALTFDLALSLYEAGDMYGVVSLKTFCSDFLRANLTLDNACAVLAVADARADTGFAEAVTAYILEKEIPQWSDLWPVFCERNPVIAFKVLNRIVRR